MEKSNKILIISLISGVFFWLALVFTPSPLFFTQHGIYYLYPFITTFELGVGSIAALVFAIYIRKKKKNFNNKLLFRFSQFFNWSFLIQPFLLILLSIFNVLSSGSIMQGILGEHNKYVEKNYPEQRRNFQENLNTGGNFPTRDFEKTPSYKSTFEKSKLGYLPFKTIILDDYLKKTNHIFFINGDYQKYTTLQLVEYDLKSKAIVKNIFTVGDGDKASHEYTIHDFEHDDKYIVWSVYKDKSFADIYVYNTALGKKQKVVTDVYYGGMQSMMPISIKIANGRIAWLVHNQEKRRDIIYIYDLTTSKQSVAAELPWPAITQGLNFQTPFIELKGDLLFYSKRESFSSQKITVYNVKDNKIIDELPVASDIAFHYVASYNEQNNYLALYAKSKSGDLVYVYDLKKKQPCNMIGLDKLATLYGDRLSTIDNLVFYTVQLNTTGFIQDHYYGEIYDLNSKTQKQYDQAIDIIETEKYFGLIKFDKTEPFNKMHFILYDK